QAENWGEIGSLRVRMGIHTGPVKVRVEDYLPGLTFFRVSHIMSAGHGGQILISLSTAELVREQLPLDITLLDLGQHRFKGLSQAEHIFQVAHPELRADFPPLATESGAHHNLPAEVSPFVGREAELSDVIGLLQDGKCQLVTILGPGGIGKSRLALQVARRLLKAFPDGVWLVPLASLSSPEFLISAAGSTLNVSFSSQVDQLEQLTRYLKHKEMLLVLDNFEHLLPEGVNLPLQIIRQASGVKLLVTSRERLNLHGEWVCELRGLSYPDVGKNLDSDDPASLGTFEAVELFALHARQSDHNFSLSDEDLPDVVRICQLLEGHPLGLELAAPWIRFMSLKEIATEIERNLDFLATSMRNIPERHRSLSAIIEQTWQQLSDAEREVLRKMAIFRGGWTREAAEAITGASLTLLASLSNKALIRYTESGRYEMHSLIRMFALTQLQSTEGEYETLQERHADFYTRYLQPRTQDLKTNRTIEALDEIGIEIDNIRAAWQWAVDQADVEALDRSAECLWLYFENRGALREGETAFRQAAQALQQPANNASLMSPSRDAVLGFVLAGQGWLWARRGEVEAGRKLMERGLAMMRQSDQLERQKEATIMIWLGSVIMLQGKFGEVQDLMQECLDLCTQIDYRWGLASSLRVLGTAAQFGGRFKQAEDYLNKSIAIYRQMGQKRMQAKAIQNLGIIAIWLGDYSHAEGLLTEAVQSSREHNDLVSLTDELRELGRLYIAVGQYQRALEMLEETLSLYESIGRLDRGAVLGYLGLTHCLMGEHEAAERFYRQSLAASKGVGHQPEIAAGSEGLGLVAYIRGDYDQSMDELEQALSIWRHSGHEPAMASTYRYLGHTAAAMGSANFPPAREYYRHALRPALEHRLAPITLDVFVGLSALYAHAGDDVTALELLHLAYAHPASSDKTKTDAHERLDQLDPQDESHLLEKARKSGEDLDWRAMAARLN
ncbi:MAG TPA: tetratricopeptide repeat protein, partial [Anaerolineales bacterium]